MSTLGAVPRPQLVRVRETMRAAGTGGRQPSASEVPALDGDVLVRYEAIYGRVAPALGTRRLLLAVLEEGIRTLLANAHGVGGRAQRLRREALRWLTKPDPRNVFSFSSICEALGFEANRLRNRVLGQMEAAQSR